jgi:hypothetical protein
MAPIVVKFEDKYSKPTSNKPTATEKKLRKSGKPITLSELKRKKEEALEQQLRGSKKDPTSAKDLKDDLDLQRLLNESHILKNLSEQRRNTDNSSGAELTLKTLNDPIIGKARVRTLDARIQQLASINGDEKKFNKLEKMPMKIRQAMIKAQSKRITNFETDARENGIILSKNKKGNLRQLDNDRAFISKEKLIGKGNIQKNKIRDRGLKISSVGRSTRNGLVLSNKDIAKIQGSQQQRRKRK